MGEPNESVESVEAMRLRVSIRVADHWPRVYREKCEHCRQMVALISADLSITAAEARALYAAFMVENAALIYRDAVTALQTMAEKQAPYLKTIAEAAEAETKPEGWREG